MTRGNASANVTASQAAHVRPLVFVQFQFDGGPVYLHNGIGRYTWSSPVASPAEVWQGIGSLGQISEITETADLSPRRVSFTLNGLDASLVAEVDDGSLYERAVIVYLGFVGDDGALVADPDERWRGYMDTAQVVGGTITISAETEMARFFRSNGKLFTDEDQQDEFSGDTGFQYLPQLIDIDLRWGPDGQAVRFAPIDPVEGYRRLNDLRSGNGR